MDSGREMCAAGEWLLWVCKKMYELIVRKCVCDLRGDADVVFQ
jgi:hypothetical protein